MSQSDAVIAAREQPCANQFMNDCVDRDGLDRIANQLGKLNTPPRIWGPCAARCQTYQESLRNRMLGRRQPPEYQIAALRQGTENASGAAVPLEGELAPFAPMKRLEHHVRDQRERTRLATHIRQNLLCEASLELEAGALGRPLDCAYKVVIAEHGHEDLVVGERLGDAGKRSEPTEAIAPHREYNRRRAGPLVRRSKQCGEEPALIRLAGAFRE
jgi:hypothetical protein